ncbi:MAG TPA: cytochrome c oxidase subunit 4, partial [Actinomycetota bacterium]
MRTATKYLLGLWLFGFVLGTIYWFVTYEWTGAVLLWFFSLTPLIIGAFAWRHGSMRVERPEDDPEAVADADPGEDLGVFPTATLWPVFLVLGVIATGAALIYGLIMLVVGI